ncbi:MAG: hypothetical protein ACYCTI_02630 [Acidimicrobiales bacterium]
MSLSTGNTFTSVVIDDCNLGGGNTLSWWNGTAWVTVTGSPGPTYTAGSPACVSVTLKPTTSPTLAQLTGTVFGVSSTSSTTPTPSPSPTPTPAPSGPGYWMAGSDGGIFSFGSAAFHGSAGGTRQASPVVGMASTPDHGGYWLVGADGAVLAYGDAVFHGSAGAIHLTAPVVGMAGV